MHSLIDDVIELYSDIKHWFKVRKRRKFEKENNLTKKRMISPMNKIGIVILIISIPIFILRLNNIRNQNFASTLDKIIEIKLLLEAEKKQFGFYPKELKTIIRKNPLRKNITLDGWKNNFSYTISKDSLNYKLISLGKDGVLSTSDDINITN
ncbi:type II secretion system protein GspG [Polaribacter sp. Hel_I_88]|uniref:type II secretion system protein GspG n=1 Tax=Polaribacter sp. Hel_I_88 TaxID=1250006 RepID=UPI00047EF9A6|nr:type II secretion system protein GspG [Polaribacter sp. Hel_I_88]